MKHPVSKLRCCKFCGISDKEVAQVVEVKTLSTYYAHVICVKDNKCPNPKLSF